MPIDIATLAATLATKFLVPYAKKGLDKIGGEVKDAAGKAVEEGVAKVWAKVKGLFSSEQDKGTWASLEELPEASAPLIQAKLEKKLEEAPEVAAELDELVNTPIPGAGGGATLQNVVAEYFGFVDLRGGTVSGGQVGGVIVNAPREPETRAPANIEGKSGGGSNPS